MVKIIENISVFFVIVSLLFLAVDKKVSDDKKERDAYEQRLEECFKQEPRTKDCDFFLWKHENRRGAR